MMMDVGLDTGDMLEKAVIPIEEKRRPAAASMTSFPWLAEI